MAETNIEWTDKVWNPITGCTKVSAGCDRCYAERMAKRLQAMGQPRYINGFNVKLHHDLLERPKQWRKPSRIFVNSMSDLFHPEVPASFIKSVFEVMRETPHHTYQVLTKRPRTALFLWPTIAPSPPPNLWLGVSVENNSTRNRIDTLRRIDAPIRFLSLEPLLEELPDLPLEGIHWVIAGGESGPGARPVPEKAVASIRDQCRNAGVPFFFKQWGGVHKKRSGRTLDGATYDEYPLTTAA